MAEGKGFVWIPLKNYSPIYRLDQIKRECSLNGTRYSRRLLAIGRQASGCRRLSSRWLSLLSLGAVRTSGRQTLLLLLAFRQIERERERFVRVRV